MTALTTLTGTTLRSRLRTETGAAHAALDQRVSKFDLQTLQGLAAYLGMHATALQSLSLIAGTSYATDAIGDLCERSKRDLARLRIETPVQELGFDPDPLAVDYVVLGSRLGSAVLKKRWRGTTDPTVLSIDAHFSAPSYLNLWHRFCEATARNAPFSAGADKAVADANALFTFFGRCIPRADERVSHD